MIIGKFSMEILHYTEDIFLKNVKVLSYRIDFYMPEKILENGEFFLGQQFVFSTSWRKFIGNSKMTKRITSNHLKKFLNNDKNLLWFNKYYKRNDNRDKHFVNKTLQEIEITSDMISEFPGIWWKDLFSFCCKIEYDDKDNGKLLYKELEKLLGHHDNRRITD